MPSSRSSPERCHIRQRASAARAAAATPSLRRTRSASASVMTLAPRSCFARRAIDARRGLGHDRGPADSTAAVVVPGGLYTPPGFLSTRDRPRARRDDTVSVPITEASVRVDCDVPQGPLRRIWTSFGYDEINWTYTPAGARALKVIGSFVEQ